MTPSDWNELRDVINGQLPDGVELTLAEVEDLMAGFPETQKDVARWSAYDTVVRERIQDELAILVLGQHWPHYADSDPTFFIDFKAALLRWRELNHPEPSRETPCR